MSNKITLEITKSDIKSANRTKGAQCDLYNEIYRATSDERGLDKITYILFSLIYFDGIIPLEKDNTHDWKITDIVSNIDNAIKNNLGNKEEYYIKKFKEIKTKLEELLGKGRIENEENNKEVLGIIQKLENYLK